VFIVTHEKNIFNSLDFKKQFFHRIGRLGESYQVMLYQSSAGWCPLLPEVMFVFQTAYQLKSAKLLFTVFSLFV